MSKLFKQVEALEYADARKVLGYLLQYDPVDIWALVHAAPDEDIGWALTELADARQASALEDQADVADADAAMREPGERVPLEKVLVNAMDVEHSFWGVEER